MITLKSSDDHIEIIVASAAAEKSLTLAGTVPGLIGGETASDGHHYFAPAHRTVLEAIIDACAKKPMTIDSRLGDLLPEPFTPRNVYLEALADIPVTYTQPWQHQTQAFWYFSDRIGAVLHICTGGGKTKLVLDVAINMPAMRTLVVCPKAVVDNWPIECSIHWPDQATYTVVAVSPHNTTIAQRVQRVASELQGNPREWPMIFIMSFETLKDKRMVDLLKTYPWDLMVVDESHKIKDASTQINKACCEIGKKATKRIAMSGTALGDKPLDIFGQMLFADSSIFGQKYWPFEQKYAEFDTAGYGKVIGIKESKRDEFNRKLSRAYFYVDRSVLDLLPVTHTYRFFDLGAEARKQFDILARSFAVDVQGNVITAANGAVRLSKLLEISSGFIIDNSGVTIDIDTGKQSALADNLDEIGDSPVVVFAKFRHDLENIRAVVENSGRRFSELSGQYNDLARWQAGKTDVIGVQMDAGSAGINLTRSPYGIYYSVDQKLITFEQSQARLVRPGQPAHVRYTYLIGRNTRDQMVYDALRMKKDVLQTVIEYTQAAGLAG